MATKSGFTSLASDDWDRGRAVGIPLAVISLADSVHRREMMMRRGIPSIWLDPFFPAIDKRRCELSDLSHLIDREEMIRLYGHELTPAEIGCALSHQSVYKRIVDLQLDLALVCEDDLVPCSAEFSEAIVYYYGILSGEGHAGARFICNIGMPSFLTDNLRTRDVLSSVENPPHVPALRLNCDSFRPIWRANAYFISRTAAQSILAAETPLRLKADDWSARAAEKTIDRIFLPASAVFEQDRSIPSTIQPAERLQGGNAPRNTAQDRLIPRIVRSLLFRYRKGKARILSRIPVHISSGKDE